MSTMKNGDKVTVHYTGKFEDGTVFDSSRDQKPLTFTVGKNELIDGFAEAISTMTVGENKTVSLSPEKAYGDRDDSLIIEFPLSNFPEEIELEAGLELELLDEDSEPVPVTVLEVKEETVVLDGNAPLAGETLIFDIEVLAINQRRT